MRQLENVRLRTRERFAEETLDFLAFGKTGDFEFLRNLTEDLKNLNAEILESKPCSLLAVRDIVLSAKFGNDKAARDLVREIFFCTTGLLERERVREVRLLVSATYARASELSADALN